MAIIITRLYLAGIVLVLLNAVSTVIFSKTIKRKRLALMGTALLLVAFWPLAIFSEDGRKRLLLTTTLF